MDANATRIEIVPTKANDSEVWPENGWASLPGELIYYDAVEKNYNGKISALRRCIRGVEGTAKNYNADTPIYGNVVAQQHNQLVQAILEIEKTVGELSDTLNKLPAPPQGFGEIADIDYGFTASLQALTANLLGVTGVVDDICPDIQFEFDCGIPVKGGTTAEYCVRIYPLNPTISFVLDFGDGSSTSTELQGKHTFQSGGPYTPTLTVYSPKSKQVVQPSTPEEGCDLQPAVPDTPAFLIPIPEPPDFPSFVAPRRFCPGPFINLPPIMLPSICLASTVPMSCCSQEPISITVSVSVCLPEYPSEISIVGCCPPSIISIVGCSEISLICCDIPSIIMVSCCNIPSVISFEGCCPPSVISIDCCDIPSIISVVCDCDLPSVISVVCDCDLPSVISVECSCDIPTYIEISLICQVVYLWKCRAS